MVVRNGIRSNSYYDSVALMRVASELRGRPGVGAISLVMGTDANLEVLAGSGLLEAGAEQAGPNDLVIAMDGDEADALDAALQDAEDMLRQPWSASEGGDDPGAEAPRRLVDVPANLALVSTPGQYAAAEALKALEYGMHVFVFSDKVPIDDERMLKQEATQRGLLVMGPDCGTAIINGTALGFANEVRRGDVGLIGASGTGLQQISTLLDSLGAGISQLVGVGSHDLSAEIGGLSMLSALDALSTDPETAVIVLVSKPPASSVAERVLTRAATVDKPVVVAFLGADLPAPDSGVTTASTLRDAAMAAGAISLGRPLPTRESPDLAGMIEDLGPRRLLRALYAGGTFAYEAEALIAPHVDRLARAVPDWTQQEGAPDLPLDHLVLDLGDDVFTAGRPHPMIDPTTRLEFLRSALNDPATGVVVLDVVLGHGADDDPAGALAPLGAESTAAGDGPVVVAFVVGTSHDSQQFAVQEQKLRAAGAAVVDSSTTAAQVACSLLMKLEGPR